MALRLVVANTYTSPEEVAEAKSELAEDIALSLLPITPDLTQTADCYDIACEAAAFFTHAGIQSHLCYGSFETSEVGERVVISPHFWLEVPLGTTNLYIDVTLPYWLTDPGSQETNLDIPTVMTREDSERLGRAYQGEREDFPRLVGKADSSAIRLYPECVFSRGLVERYRNLCV